MTQLYIIPYSLNTFMLATSFEVHKNSMSELGEGLLSPFYSWEMTCPGLTHPAWDGAEPPSCLVSWSILVPPPGADTADSVMQTTLPVHRHTGTSIQARIQGSSHPLNFPLEKLRPTGVSERTFPRSHRKGSPSPDT